MSCQHFPVYAIENAVDHMPFLLWCAACGSLAMSDGSIIRLTVYADPRPDGAAPWVPPGGTRIGAPGGKR
jgi:hypothetical protein